MGNWRRVWIVGTIPREQVEPLRAALTEPDYGSIDWNAEDARASECCCLTIGKGLCGLGSWPAESMNAVGNLYERDYRPDDVRLACAEYVLTVAPGAEFKVHCGDDYERSKCVATVTVEDGGVSLGDPEIASLPEIGEAQITGNLFAAIFGFRGGAS